MGPRQIRPPLAAATILLALTTALAAAAKVECTEPERYAVEFPQGGDVPIKLYQTNKGGGIGSVAVELIADKLLLCSDEIGSVNEVRLPAGVAIDLEPGKEATAGNRYWVRSNQVRFAERQAQKQFICERNQVKTRLAGGAAGGESCK